MDQNNLEDVDKLEIEPLSDSDLDSVSGGSGEELSCSTSGCSNTVIQQPSDGTVAS